MADNTIDEIMHNKYGEGELARYEKKQLYMKGGTFDKIFDILSTFGYLSGGYELEKRRRYEEVQSKYAGTWDEESERAMESELRLINAEFSTPWLSIVQGAGDRNLRESMRYAKRHRIEYAEVAEIESFWAGVGVNVLTDPTSFIPAGAIKGVGRGVMSRLPARAQAPIRTAGRQVDVAIDPVRRGVAGAKAAAGRGVRRAAGRVLGKVYAGVDKLRDVAGEAFTLGYKLKKAGGKSAEFFETYTEMLMERAGQATQSFYEIKQLGKPYHDMGKKATKYIEEGISTGNQNLDQYIDDTVVPYVNKMHADAVAAGIDIGYVTDYVPHMITRRGKKLFDKSDDAGDAYTYLAERTNIILGRERGWDATISEINEAMGEEVFHEDLWVALGEYAKKGSRDITTKKWLADVVSSYGLDTAVQGAKEAMTKTAEKAFTELAKHRKSVTEIAQVAPERGLDVATVKSKLYGVIERHSRGIFKGKTREAREAADAYIDYSARHTSAVGSIAAKRQDVLDIENQIAKELRRVSGISRVDVERFGTMYATASKRLEDVMTAEKSTRDVATAAYEKLTGKILDPIESKIGVLEPTSLQKKTLKQTPGAMPEGYKIPKRADIDVPLPNEIADHLDTLVEEGGPETPLQSAHGVYKKVYNFWKQIQTTGYIVPHTGFFGRNVATGMLQNIQEIGLYRTTRGVVDSIRLSKGKGTFKTAEFGEVDAEEMRKIVRLSGVVESTGMADIELAQRMYPTTAQMAKDMPTTLMTETESSVRTPLLLEELRVGTMKSAREIINRVHFNYSPEFHTQTEIALKNIFPFWTWAARNIARQVKQLSTRPRFFQRAGQVQRESIRTAGLEEEYKERDEYMMNQYLVANILDPEAMSRIPMPFLDLAMDPASAYFMLSPVKSIVELGAIEAGWGSKEYKREKQAAILEKLVSGRYGSTTKALARDDRSRAEKLQYMSGLPAYTTKPTRAGYEDFDAFRYREYVPTKTEEYEAWVSAGQPEAFRTVLLGEKFGGMEIPKDTYTQPAWWKVWEKRKLIEGQRPGYELGGIPQELYGAYQQYDWTQSEWDDITQYQGEERTAAIRGYLEKYMDWSGAQSRQEEATLQQKIAAWTRSGKPQDAVHRVYRTDEGDIIGVASYTQDEIDEIQGYVSKRMQLSNAAFEWAFSQTGMAPEDFILQEFRKKNVAYLDMHAAREELAEFEVDAPVSGIGFSETAMKEYTSYRKGRVEYEQQLIERALLTGEGV